jgi:hypothetical protein
MITNRTYGIDPDVVAYQARLTAGGVQALNPNALRKLNQFVIGLKKLNVWGLITDIWLSGSEYNAISGTITYALKSGTNNATLSTPYIFTTKGLSFTNNGRLTTPSYTLWTPMTIWCIANTKSTTTTTNTLLYAESYLTNGFRVGFNSDSAISFHTSESGGNIGLGFNPNTPTPYVLDQYYNIFFGVNSSKAYLYVNNNKTSSTSSKTMNTRTTTLPFGQAGGGKANLNGDLPFACVAQRDIEPYYDDLYKLVKSTVGGNLGLP